MNKDFDIYSYISEKTNLEKHQIKAILAPYFYSTSLSLGEPKSKSEEDIKAWCDEVIKKVIKQGKKGGKMKTEQTNSNDKQFNIWCEGHKANGDSSTAHLIGISWGKTFKEACENLAKNNDEFNYYFDNSNMTYWGCKLFDNEDDARKQFG